MVHLLHFTLLVSAVLCQDPIPSIIDDLNNIIRGIPPYIGDCSTTVVLRSNLRFTLYNQNNLQNGIVLDDTNIQEVNSALRLILIIHSWLQNDSKGWVIEMKRVYLSNTNANIVSVDWSPYAQINYGAAVCAVPLVAKFVSDLIYNITSGNPTWLNNTQINGYSLGAHIAGIAGQEVQSKTNGLKLGRINSLDAAGPGFINITKNSRLDSQDAWFVQGIHTSDDRFGYGPPYGTVDFRVNKVLQSCGSAQVGCPANPGVAINANDNVFQQRLPALFCDTIRAVAYFNESINSLNFLGIKCSNCASFTPNMLLRQCGSSQTTIMGENCPLNVAGEYYLTTNDNNPFAKGLQGTQGVLIV
ncbi:hypothetical protein ILUMI_10636 [Ignelater luminosus]|uniref:Lipase domain-containing protein n=1 Tax=Ignelater luminosus TaxID=2038154 RepID=A0A8K0CXR7_IGNLU|nr:hypothetical protein ILUMI_10636 [Ignelater luminosus]